MPKFVKLATLAAQQSPVSTRIGLCEDNEQGLWKSTVITSGCEVVVWGKLRLWVVYVFQQSLVYTDTSMF